MVCGFKNYNQYIQIEEADFFHSLFSVNHFKRSKEKTIFFCYFLSNLKIGGRGSFFYLLFIMAGYDRLYWVLISPAGLGISRNRAYCRGKALENLQFF